MLATALPARGGAAEPGSIIGTVARKGGEGLFARVEVCAESTSGAPGAGKECANVESGSYEIGGLAAGEYTVEFSDEFREYVKEFYGGVSERDEATPVTVVAGSSTVVNAELEKAALIGGFVSEAFSERVIEGVTACARQVNGKASACGVSDWGGRYTINGLPAGSYELEFLVDETRENLLSQKYPQDISLYEGEDQNTIWVELLPAGEVRGTVRAAATGALLAGIEVCISQAERVRPFSCVTSGPYGTYGFDGVKAGWFKVVFSPEAKDIGLGPEWEFEPDGYPTQWWNGAGSFATATFLYVAVRQHVNDIDGSLGPGPVSTPSATVSPSDTSQPNPPTSVVAPTSPQPKPNLRCKRGFAKRKVLGKARCVRRHKPKHRHVTHRP